jgi:hypothetical protein
VNEHEVAAGVAAANTSHSFGSSEHEAVDDEAVTDWPPAESSLAETSYAEIGYIDLQVEVEDAELQEDTLSLTAAGSPRSQTSSSYAGVTATDETVTGVTAGETAASGNDSAAVRRIELRRRAYFGRVQRNAASGTDSEQQCNDAEHDADAIAVDVNTGSSNNAAAAATAAVVPRGRVLHSHLAAPPGADVSTTSAVCERSDQRSDQRLDQRSPTPTVVQSHEQQLWERFTLAKAVVSASTGRSSSSSAAGNALMHQLMECIQGGSTKQLRSVLDCSEAQAVLQQAVCSGNDCEGGMYAHITTYITYKEVSYTCMHSLDYCSTLVCASAALMAVIALSC